MYGKSDFLHHIGMTYRKYPRTALTVDLSAMMDVVFLLITFFLLAAKFKPSEPMAVEVPRTVTNGVDVPPNNILTLYFNQEGRVFVGSEEISIRDLASWVKAHPENRGHIWIKGDKRAPYPIFQAVVKAFTQNKIYHFTLVTEI